MSKASKWIKAGTALLNNPKELVACPECEQNNLIVFDSGGPTGFESEMVERFMVCPNCKSYNVVLMKRRFDQTELVCEIQPPFKINEVIESLVNQKSIFPSDSD